ncbi:PREDICTED: 39S ribosomal protein L30, mitochondrial [Ceratosolen solmsi marchali]|uniref:Large ribosomal subunit protein uL30m n=1 Tax=Ceratosolen solmsi marchali TaxID=326594 RepID=A0AAJ7E187_9HYME|nr:PREDICTED: 39S ribosomal protein L30, mitochondrial [Ceratosolen solmsi marchali]
MLKAVRAFFNQRRYFKHRSTPKTWKKDGVKYGLVTYYPRHPDHVDPYFEPSKLLLIERIKPLKGCPYWEKNILLSIGLASEKKVRHQTVVKNIPEMCARLWKIKHLIKVTPVELPKNLPADVDSISSYLHDSGKLLIFPKIDEKRYKATEEFINNPKRLDGDTLQEKLRLKWLNAME